MRGKLWAGAMLVAGAVLAFSAGDVMAQGGKGKGPFGGKGPDRGGASLEKQIEELRAQIKDLERQIAKLSPAKEEGKKGFGRFDSDKFKEMAKKFGDMKGKFGDKKGEMAKKFEGKGPFGKGGFGKGFGKGPFGKEGAKDMGKGKGKDKGMERGKGPMRGGEKKDVPMTRAPERGGSSVTRALDDLQRSLDSLRKALEKR